ncbi:MAG: alpha/beta hydrolase [Proteobacteria bacterium]|nr:alpha/beta hydrolase [Pseudomonadota bacterium]
MSTVEVQGREVYYERHAEAGAEGRTPLVLVMGIGGSCRGWLPLQVPAFRRSRPTVVFDNRGVGRSRDTGEAFSTADLGADLVGLLDALELEQADVLGAFMGGMAAQELALQAPDRVRRLVLVGTYARADAKRRLLLEDWAGLARRGVPLEAMVRKRLVWTLEDETLEQTDLIESMVEFFTRDGAPMTSDLFARQCEACRDHDTYDRLGQLRAPTLVLCGRHDQLTPPKFHRQLADEIPDATLVTFTYGAHLVMAEAAERFHQVVLEFLDRS